MNNIIAQICGVIAIILTMMSVHQEEKKRVLITQFLANIAYLIQYLCLFAWSGAAMTFLAIIRCFIFYYYDKNNKPKSVPVLIIICLLMIFCGIFTYDGLISILPVIVAISYSYAMWQNNMKIFRIVSIISPVLWIIYDIYVSAFTVIVASIFEFISAFFAVLRFDIDKKR